MRRLRLRAQGAQRLGGRCRPAPGAVIESRPVPAVELEPRPGKPGARAYEAFLKLFEAGVLVRWTGDVLAFAPPLIAERAQIERIFAAVRDALKNLA